MSRHKSPFNTPEYEAAHLFIAAVPSMAEQARVAAKKDSFSYRGFMVGTAALGFNREWRTSTTISAGNIKARQSKEKVCSEQVTVGKIEKINRDKKRDPEEKIDFIGGLVVAGTNDRTKIKEVTHIDATTLWPCVPCVTGVFQNSELILPDTPVVTVGLERDYWQVHTPHALLARHQEGVDVASQYGFQNWDKRIELLDVLVAAQDGQVATERVSMSLLAVKALTANIASDF